LALANQKDGGIIIIGIDNDGNKVGISDDNFKTFKENHINDSLKGKTNQPIKIKVELFKIKLEKEKSAKNFVFIRVFEAKEFPVIYTGDLEKINDEGNTSLGNIELKNGRTL